MSKTPSLKTVINTFLTRVNSSVELYNAIQPFTLGTWDSIKGYEILYPTQARKIISHAFLYVIVGWEDFVESCFIRYLVGASSPSGYKPRLRLGTCKSLSHAYEVISTLKGFDPNKQYLNWSNWGEIENKALIFFEKGEPFSLLSHKDRLRLKDAFNIRNKIAHASRKCQQDFIKVAKQHLGLTPETPLSQGFDVGRLLLEISNRGFGQCKEEPFFIQYMNLFTEIADKIAPSEVVI